MKLTKKQYWAVIGIAFILLIVNGWLVWKLINDEVPKQCPVPNEISSCDCVYNALGDKSLRYCICYPRQRFDISNDIIQEFEIKKGGN